MEVNSLTPYSRSLYLHCLPSPITQISTSYWFILIIIKTCCHFLHIKKIRIKTFIDLSQLCSPVWEKVHVGILYLFSSYLISYYLFFKKITFGCAGSLLLHRFFFSCGEGWGALSSCGTGTSHCGGLSCCRAWS